MCNLNKYRIVFALIITSPAIVIGQLTSRQAERIADAVPQKARVTPKKPRRVLIWNTPFMDKCPHKGYCVP